MSVPRGDPGFTLIEVVIVILLVAVMSIVAIPNFIDLGTTSRNAVAKDQLQSIKRAITGDSRVTAGGTYTFAGYEADVGKLPTTLNDLATQPGGVANYDPLQRTGWRGPYVDNASSTNFKLDPWGKVIIYTTSPRQLQSCGPDGICNNADDITLTY